MINVHMLAADFRLIRHKVSTCSVRVGLVGVCGGGEGGGGTRTCWPPVCRASHG